MSSTTAQWRATIHSPLPCSASSHHGNPPGTAFSRRAVILQPSVTMPQSVFPSGRALRRLVIPHTETTTTAAPPLQLPVPAQPAAFGRHRAFCFPRHLWDPSGFPPPRAYYSFPPSLGLNAQTLPKTEVSEPPTLPTLLGAVAVQQAESKDATIIWKCFCCTCLSDWGEGG